MFCFFQVTVLLNVNQMTVQAFEEKILRGALNMISPDVMVDDGKGTVLISSDEDETKDNLIKSLSVSLHDPDSLFFCRRQFLFIINIFIFQDFNICDGTRLRCEDFHQEYNLNITIAHR